MSASLAEAPAERLSALNDVPADPGRDYVLYWQVMARRTRFNFALEHAVALARAWARPLVVLEALRCGYPWASDRLHRFALDGMHDNAAAYAEARMAHHAYVEPEPGAARGLLEALGGRACVVVTDEFPEFFLPHMLRAAGERLGTLGVRLEAVDGNGLLPMRLGEKAWSAAPHFRRQLQRALPAHLGRFPVAEPLAAARRLPALAGEAARHVAGVRARWPAASLDLLDQGEAGRRALGALPIDHAVPPVPFAGGPAKALVVLGDFLDRKFDTYADRRHEAEDPSTSGLSPYLHWGFVGAHEVFARVAAREGWNVARLAPKPTGRREGWWGMSPNAEAFLDEFVTWRELSYNTACYLPAHDTYGSLPEWARATMEAHRGDRRAALFPRDQLEAGATYDALWNATQGQLRADGRIHNYLRILWGKKFLEWTRSGEEALACMLHVNNRWALDGRNPNSTSGITWVLGRYDHAWQERPVIGKIRPMSSEATARKVRVGDYVRRYTAGLPGAGQTAVMDRGPSRGAGTSGLDVLPDG